jgi:hypothetical protein
VAEARWVREMERRAGENERGREGEIWGKVVGFGVVRMAGGAHARNPTCRETLACPISALSVGADAGLTTSFIRLRI